MRKYAYLAKLEELLAALPAQERQDALNYYEEYFDAAGNDQEEQTARELGDPAEVARKILEGEGIQPEESAVPPQESPAGQPPVEKQQEEQVTPPAGPEPPALDKPETYPTTGVAKQPKRKKPRRLWVIFWVVVVLALFIQISVLLLGLEPRGGGSAIEVAEVASSMVAGPVEEAPVTPQPTGSLEAAGPVVYSGTLDTPGKGPLFVTVTRGNVAFSSGEQASVEVRNVDVNSQVSYSQTVDEGYAFVCDSTDPNTHITITLPPDAFERLEVHISNSGAIELGDLQIRELDVFTASGPIQSGNIRVEELNAVTALGNIWLEKVSNGVNYQTSDVCLQAPKGYVAANFTAPRSEWQSDINAPEGVVETTQGKAESGTASRKLQVVAASTVNLKYGV